VGVGQTNTIARFWRVFRSLPKGEQALTVCATSVAVAGVSLGPMALRADDDRPAPPSQATVESGMPEGAERRILVDGLVELLRSCRAIIGERDGDRGDAAASITLWHNDGTEPGVVNLSEVLTVGHSKLLQTLVVYSAPRELSWAPAPAELTYADDPVRIWKETPEASASVIATGVADLRVSRSPETGGSATVRLRLTWAAGMSDSTEETVLAVTLPSFQGR